MVKIYREKVYSRNKFKNYSANFVKKFNSADGESPAEVDYWHPAVNSDRPESETKIQKDLQKKSKVQLSSPSRSISTNQTSNDPLIENRYFLLKAFLMRMFILKAILLLS